MSRDRIQYVGLTNKIFLYLSVVSFLLMGCFYWFIIDRNSKEIYKNIDLNANILTDLLAQTTAGLLWRYDYEQAKLLLDRGVNSSSIGSVAIYDDKQNLIAEKRVSQAGDRVYLRNVFYDGKSVGSVRVEISTTEMKKLVYANATILAGFMLAIQIVLGLLMFLIIRRSIRPIFTQMKNLNAMLDSNVHSVERLNLSSQNLQERASKQLHAVQDWMGETKKILEESKQISSSAEESLTVIKDIANNALAGNEVMKEVSLSISEIMKVGDQLKGIAKKNTETVLYKTDILNRLVFKTKFLSFNANIEAAKAKEFGKGFSVVAGELEKLTQVSGNAANEISEFNEQSMHEINGAVEHAMTTFEKGHNIIEKAIRYFEEISKTINQIDHNTSSILVNIQKNSELIQKIFGPAEELKLLASSNSESAIKISEDSISIKNLNTNIVAFIESLHRMMFGKKFSEQ